MSEGNRMDGEYRYMTDKELEALIAGVEDHGMLAPPVYLKELIMKEAKGLAAVRKKGIDKKTARRVLMVYRAKVIGAAAAAIFCLVMVPMEIDGGKPDGSSQWRQKVIEEDMKYYQEESERLRNEMEIRKGGFGGFMENLLGEETAGKAVSIWNGMTGLFGWEERDYE